MVVVDAVVYLLIKLVAALCKLCWSVFSLIVKYKYNMLKKIFYQGFNSLSDFIDFVGECWNAIVGTDFALCLSLLWKFGSLTILPSIHYYKVPLIRYNGLLCLQQKFKVNLVKGIKQIRSLATVSP